MREHEHTAKDEPGTNPTHDEVAKEAYAIYVKEGRPQGHADQNRLDAETQLQHAGAGQAAHREYIDSARPEQHPLAVYEQFLRALHPGQQVVR